MENNNKIMNGQFFTITNPFNHDLFFRWYELIKNVESETFIEPFAGSNNIIKMIEELNLPQPKSWKAYDIDPPSYNVVPEFNVFKQDTIKDFPKGHKVGITNPPYLAKTNTNHIIRYFLFFLLVFESHHLVDTTLVTLITGKWSRQPCLNNLTCWTKP